MNKMLDLRDTRLIEGTREQGVPTSTQKRRQIVLVFQGGGALGAFQAGVYQALHEAGIEPDWIIGTSIGAINASLIAGNEPQDRLDRLRGILASDAKQRCKCVLDLAWGVRHGVLLVNPTRRHSGIL